MKEKVAVVGAGTAGLIAARDLAAFGIATKVYDQKTRLGYPAKASGIVSINGLNILGIDYKSAATNTLYGARIHAGNAVMRIMSKKPQARVLDREKLNLVCYDEAVDRGAVVQTGLKMDNQRIDELHKDNIIIGADGPLSAVAKHFSMGSIKKYTLTYKADFNVDVGDARVVDLFFDNSIAPKFFAWLCPNAKDILEVGIGVDAKYGNSKTAFERFVKMKEVRDQLEKGRMLDGYASIIPMRTARRVVEAEKEVLLVGDAAGQVKPTTGGGIVFGGSAAMLAARVIHEHIKLGTSLERYEKLFRKSFGTDMKLHSVLNKIYANVNEKRLEALINISKTLGFENFLSNYGDMDRPSVMLKRFFLRGLEK
ncbi:MAG: NAD(P)/FAD-dependent oxidoreductase [Candidatus Micrarchaeota archaeon]|nr:NAD(P)/FAD-dependent oxidoreductase [Candidatus Micrarchaeota archaeon]